MADVTISATMHGTAYGTAFQNTTYWTSPTVGYTFGIDSGFDFVYWKTSDAGANWSSTPIDIKAATCVGFAIWAKEWTTGDKTDTIVHTWYLDQAAETIHYRSLDTSSDTLGTERSVKVVTSISTGSAPADRSVSGIETQGGNLLLAWRVDPDGEHGLARSIDSGANWTDRTDIFDGDGDICLLTPGNVSAGDTADCWGFYIDATANELSLKEYDDSGNSFNETAIATVVENFGGAWNLGAAYRQSDDHTIVAAWDEFDSATAELKVWDVASNASITAKTSIVAAGADQAEAIECPVFINQQNDYIYIAYISGGTWGSLEDVHYQVSRDGGASWDGEVSMSVDTQDDHRNVWSGNSVGGKSVV